MTNLELANTPSNLKATLGTVSLQIKVRGPSDVMEAVTASSIRAVADLSSVGTSTGQFSVPVDVYVDGFSGIGAMGSYNVLVSISEPTESDGHRSGGGRESQRCTGAQQFSGNRRYTGGVK